MAPRPGFEVVSETDQPVEHPQRSAAMVLLALKALSQRAIAATKDVFTLLSTFSAWWLWWSIPDPSNTQIVSLSIYAAFVLAANVIVRRV